MRTIQREDSIYNVLVIGICSRNHFYHILLKTFTNIIYVYYTSCEWYYFLTYTVHNASIYTFCELKNKSVTKVYFLYSFTFRAISMLPFCCRKQICILIWILISRAYINKYQVPVLAKEFAFKLESSTRVYVCYKY